MLLTLQNIIVYIAMFFGLYVSIFYLMTFFENSKNMKTPEPKRFPKISIIIPAYNEEKVIRNTIKSVLSVEYPKKEIIVVDDCSADNTYKKAKEYEKYGVRVFTKKRSGKGSTVNFGIKKSSGELVMPLDSDSFPEKDCLKKMVGHFEDPRVMAVTPTLKVYNPKNLLERLQTLEYTLAAFVKRILTFMSSLSMVPGAPLIRKDFIKKYGYFDEHNLTEDFEMGLRIQSKNYNVIQSLDAVVYTVVPNNLKKLFRQRIRWDYGILWNLRKHSSMISFAYGDLGIFLLPVMLISLGLTGFLVLYFIAMTIWNTVHSIYLLSLIGFDISYQLPGFQINILNFFFNEKVFLLLVSFMVGLIMYLLAKKHVKEKFRPDYILYIFVYGWIIGFFRVIAITHFLLRRKPRWVR